MFLAGLTSFTERREQYWLARFFDSTVLLRSCLHHLLPPPHDSMISVTLKSSFEISAYSIPNTTKQFQSFISYALSKYQTS